MKNGLFGTYVERKSGFLVAFKIPDKLDNAFNKATIAAFENVPRSLKKSFIVDNGKVFAARKKLSESTDMKTFFCDPYSP